MAVYQGTEAAAWAAQSYGIGPCDLVWAHLEFCHFLFFSFFLFCFIPSFQIPNFELNLNFVAHLYTD
jgi:hypothetical protein